MIAEQKKIGQPDRLILTGDGIEVVTSGRLTDRFDKMIDAIDDRRHVIPNDGGIPGHGHRTFRFLVSGEAGKAVLLKYTAQKSRDLEMTLRLEEGVTAQE